MDRRGHRKEYAQNGLEELRDNVDTLLVINNDKLIEVFGDLTLSQAFGKANEVLNTATKGIAEVISQTLMVNIDLNDAKRVLKNSGTAVMGQAYAAGENRAIEAVEAALDSPLLNDNNIKGAQQVLLKIVTGSGEQEIRMTELFSIKKHIQDAAGCDVNIIEGIGVEDGLSDQISVTVIATGFEVKDGFGPRKPEPPKVYDLDGDDSNLDVVVEESTTEDKLIVDEPTEEAPQATINFEEINPVINFDLNTDVEVQKEETIESLVTKEEEVLVEQEEVAPLNFEIKELETQEEAPVVHLLELDDMDSEANLPEEIIPDLKDEKEISKTPINHGISAEQMAIRSRERMDRLRDISFKLRTPSGLTDLENEPAYKRRNVELDEAPHSSESEVAQYTLSEDNDNNVEIKPNNFLHDNVD